MTSPNLSNYLKIPPMKYDQKLLFNFFLIRHWDNNFCLAVWLKTQWTQKCLSLSGQSSFCDTQVTDPLGAGHLFLLIYLWRYHYHQQCITLQSFSGSNMLSIFIFLMTRITSRSKDSRNCFHFTFKETGTQ